MATYYKFSIVLEPPQSLDASLVAALYKAGCVDAALCADELRMKLKFTREAESQLQAVASALQQIAEADKNLRVLGVELD